MQWRKIMNELEPIEDRLRASIDKNITADLRVGGLMWMSQAMEFAKLMAIAGVAVPRHLRGNPGACLGIVTQALNWEMDPFAVANKSYAVSDRLAYESQLINAVILRRAPIVDRFAVNYSGSGKTRRCTVSARIKSGAMLEYESPEMGVIPTQNSPLWKADPDQQLFYFASRAFCRRHFPDVLLGVYTRDELQDFAPAPEQSKQSLGDKLTAIASKPVPRPPIYPAEWKDEQPHFGPPEGVSDYADPQTGEFVEVTPPLDIDGMDTDTATVVLAGQLAARQGDAAYKKWWNRLSAPDAERAKPHLEAIRAHLP